MISLEEAACQRVLVVVCGAGGANLGYVVGWSDDGCEAVVERPDGIVARMLDTGGLWCREVSEGSWGDPGSC